MPREHDVLGVWVELREKWQHERVRRRLVEESRFVGRRQRTAVERVGVCPQRVEVVLLAAGEVPDEEADRVRGVDVVVGRSVDAVVVTEVGERRDEVRLGVGGDLGVRAEHALQERRARAGRRHEEDEALLDVHGARPERGSWILGVRQAKLYG